MNILLVDDDDKVFVRLRKYFSKRKNIHVIYCKDFLEIKNFQILYKFDLVILDLNNGNPALNDTEAGTSVLTSIYKHSFLPIIILSAWADDYENPYKGNHFIKIVKKGQNELKELNKAIQEYEGFIEKQKSIADVITSHISEIYRDSYGNMIKNYNSSTKNDKAQIFIHLMKRRLAASFDTNPEHGSIKPWEIYLYPALGEQLLTGDIIKKKGKNREIPSSYKIILSPSCDLQSENNRKHIENVIVANFVSVKSAIPLRSEIKNKLLTTSSPERYMLFSELVDVFPHMACDLKSIEVVKFNSIGKGKSYERIVSIDSPFREALTWAFLHINGRPGLPDRDIYIWINNIKEKCYQENKS
jgi:hypothetical protein